MTTRIDIRASSLSNRLLSSFLLASAPPNSASGSKGASGSLLWCPKVCSSRFVFSRSFEDIPLAGVRLAYLSCGGERRGSDSSWLKLLPLLMHVSKVSAPTQKERSSRTPWSSSSSCARVWSLSNSRSFGSVADQPVISHGFASRGRVHKRRGTNLPERWALPR